MKYLSIPEKIQKDKRIKFEGKLIYSYIFVKSFEKNYNSSKYRRVTALS